MKHPLISTLLGTLISGAILVWLLSGTSFETIVAGLERLPAWRVLGALLFLAAVQWFRAWRFTVLVTGEVRAPSAALVRVVLQLLLSNYLLPFKLGEVAFPVLMRRAFGTDIGHAVGHLLLARAFDFAIVVGLMLIAAAAAGGIGPFASAPLAALGLLSLMSPVVLVVVLAHLRDRLLHRSSVVQRLTEGAATARPPELLVALTGFSIAIWASHIAAAILVCAAVAPAVDLAAIAMGNAASHLAFALPVPSIAGLGAPQAAWVAALNLIGVEWSLATTLAIVSHSVLLLAVVLLGVAALLPWPGDAARRSGDKSLGLPPINFTRPS